MPLQSPLIKLMHPFWINVSPYLHKIQILLIPDLYSSPLIANKYKTLSVVRSLPGLSASTSHPVVQPKERTSFSDFCATSCRNTWGSRGAAVPLGPGRISALIHTGPCSWSRTSSSRVIDGDTAARLNQNANQCWSTTHSSAAKTVWEKSTQAWLVSTWALFKSKNIVLCSVKKFKPPFEIQFYSFVWFHNFFKPVLQSYITVVVRWVSHNRHFWSWPLRRTSASIICAEPQWDQEKTSSHNTLFLKLDHVRKTKRYCRSKVNASSGCTYLVEPLWVCFYCLQHDTTQYQRHLFFVSSPCWGNIPVYVRSLVLRIWNIQFHWFFSSGQCNDSTYLIGKLASYVSFLTFGVWQWLLFEVANDQRCETVAYKTKRYHLCLTNPIYCYK